MIVRHDNLTNAAKRIFVSSDSSLALRTLSSTTSNAANHDNKDSKGFVSRLEGHFNHLSGTTEIEALKVKVQTASEQFDKATHDLVNARKLVDASLQEWQDVSGQHLTLLQRKESWSPDDAQTFTALITKEVKTKRHLQDAQQALHQAETAATQSQMDYMNRLRQRYQEEQSWQDHWRVLGTYGTWSLIVLNSMIFLASQYYQYRREQGRLLEIERIIVNSNRQDTTHPEASSKTPTVGLDVKDSSPSKVTKRAKSKRRKRATGTKVPDRDADSLEQSHDKDGKQEQQDENVFVRAWRTGFPLKKNKTREEENATRAAPSSSSPPNNTASDEDSSTRHVVVARLVQFWTKTVSSSKELMQSDKLDIKEIHIPSAVFGASVMGFLVMVVSIGLSSSSNRRG